MLEGATATDLVLTITERLRKHGVVGKFVEFFGPGLEHLTIADRATLGNMCPEYGATIAIFPIDEMTLDYLRLTGRDEAQVQLVEAYAKAQGLFRGAGDPDPVYSETIELDLATVEPSLAGPAAARRIACRSKHAQERLPGGARLDCRRRRRRRAHRAASRASAASAARLRVADPAGGRAARSRLGRDRRDHELHEHVESERDDRRRAAREEGRRARAAAQALGEDEPGARLEGRHRVPAQGRARAATWTQLGFNLVGYGCTTCIGNSGPLPDDVSAEIDARNLVVASVLSGNRNFEGRIQQQVRANYLASPPLVVAYALAGR